MPMMPPTTPDPSGWTMKKDAIPAVTAPLASPSNTGADARAQRAKATNMAAKPAMPIASAAGTLGLPVAVSFTVETDGRLPSGEGLGQARQRPGGRTGDGCCADPALLEHQFVA